MYFHITTSANEYRAIKKHGILDLKRAYLCEESELRRFLNQHCVFIDLDNKYLSYNNRKYDISFNVESRPTIQTEEDYCWLVGRKFYYDYTTCGFLSVCEQRPYSGEVHYRPEILGNIDRLLNLDLSGE